MACLVFRGYGARRIGDELGLSEPTVKSYTSRVYRKADVHPKQEFIAYVEACLDEKSGPVGNIDDPRL